MTNKRIQSSKETKEVVYVPMIIDKDLIAHYKKKGYKIKTYLLGNRKVPCIMVESDESFKKDYIRMMDTERKKEDRKNRCLISNGKGGFIMCPECNKCKECKKYVSWDFDRYHALSIEKLTEGDNDDDKVIGIAGNYNVEEEATSKVTAEYILDCLLKIDIEYYNIFKMLLENPKVSEIANELAEELDIAPSTARDKIKKVQNLAQKLYSNK